MFAVLTDAVACFQKYLGAKNRGGRNLFHEAELWFVDGDRSWPFSFERICEVFDISPDYLRHGLTEWRRAHESRKISCKRSRESLRYQHRVEYNRVYNPERVSSLVAL